MSKVARDKVYPSPGSFVRVDASCRIRAQDVAALSEPQAVALLAGIAKVLHAAGEADAALTPTPPPEEDAR